MHANADITHTLTSQMLHVYKTALSDTSVNSFMLNQRTSEVVLFRGEGPQVKYASGA